MSPSRGAAQQRHVPVLRDRVVQLLQPALQRPGAVFVDGTLGMGGHTEAVLEKCPLATGYGVDRDPQALELAAERLRRFGSRFVPIRATYDQAFDELTARGAAAADGVLFDLGVSSLQLDALDRGFSYSKDAPLDMRMDPDQPLTAAQVLNTYPQDRLAQLLHDFGEERYARRIAGAIVREREARPWQTSGPLVDLLRRTIPGTSQRSSGHPAKRTFQALRIEVNAELDTWRRALPAAIAHLRVGGRLVVLSYHSLEDRITKRLLTEGSTSSAPAGMPVELPEQTPYLKLLVRGAEQAPPEEIHDNPRAASVRLRAATRTRTTEGSLR